MLIWLQILGYDIFLSFAFVYAVKPMDQAMGAVSMRRFVVIVAMVRAPVADSDGWGSNPGEGIF